MADFTIKKYTLEDKGLWDNFMKNSPNSSFLFLRDFMTYHQDRFNDYSLIIYRNKKLFALLPGHSKNQQFCSHLGLTYGGFIFGKRQKTTLIEDAFNHTKAFLKTQGFSQLVLKLMPQIYQNEYSSAIDYLLFQQNAELIQRDLNYIVDLQKPINIHKSKRKLLNKDYIQDLRIEKVHSLAPFWTQILKPVLNTKHDAEPVHSLSEISTLQATFPEHIQQYNVFKAEELIAGMTLFISNGVVKSQYGAASELGEKFKALDFLYLKLFPKFKSENYRYFDLGTTTENSGQTYNHGLANYKEELGAHPINQDRYLLNL